MLLAIGLGLIALGVVLLVYGLVLAGHADDNRPRISECLHHTANCDDDRIAEDKRKVAETMGKES